MIKYLNKEIEEYIINFLHIEYIDYLDTINFSKYINDYASIYIYVLIESDLSMFEYIHNKCGLNKFKLQFIFMTVLPKINEDKLDYLIANFSDELISTLLNKKYIYLLNLLTHEQSLEFINKIFNLTCINNNFIFKYKFFYIDNHVKYNDIRVLKLLINLKKIKQTHVIEIISAIKYNNITLDKLQDILHMFNISHHKYIMVLENDQCMLNYILETANIHIIDWILCQYINYDYSCSFVYNILYSSCCNSNLEIIKSVYDYLILKSHISSIALTKILSRILNHILNCTYKNKKKTRQYKKSDIIIKNTILTRKIILSLIDLGAKPCPSFYNYYEYYKMIVK